MTIIAGQPLDLPTIIAAINDINDLKAQLGLDKNESVIIGQDRVATVYPTSGISVEAANISIDKTEAKSDQIGFRHTFVTKFSKPPVVTSTMLHTAGSNVVQDHSIVITKITTQEVSGYVRFQSSGSVANTSLNIIAVGSAIGV